jgi:sulfide:quinone oxidoreductase
MRHSTKPKVVVVGGGFGGLESALYVRSRLPDEVAITMLSEDDFFLFRPNTIYVPFGLDPKKLRLRLAGPTRRKDIHFVQTRVNEIDPVSRKVYGGGTTCPYDYLVVATGAHAVLDAVPGFAEFAQPAWSVDHMLELRARFHDVFNRAHEGEHLQVLFIIPPGNRCCGPLYEITLMLDAWLDRKKIRGSVEISLATYEETFVQAFGPRVHDIVADELAARGIRSFTAHELERVDEHEAYFRNGVSIPFDLAVAFPPYTASTSFHNLPTDQHGFISTELTSRQVVGHPGVYAVGDASDYPVKQAFMAFLQADAAADHLAALVLDTDPQLDFEMINMRLMGAADASVFGRPPIAGGVAGNGHSGANKLGEPVDSATVDAIRSAMYRIGSSPIWRLGKLALGTYLPWRFKAGNPFYSGLPWKGMEASLKTVTSAGAPIPVP